jgi:hypothetical protein
LSKKKCSSRHQIKKSNGHAACTRAKPMLPAVLHDSDIDGPDGRPLRSSRKGVGRPWHTAMAWAITTIKWMIGNYMVDNHPTK